MFYESLETLLDLLCQGSQLHICIHDVSGLLEIPSLVLPFSYKTHSTGFCNAGKETALGLNLCMRCKERSNKKAIRLRETFDGHCPYGLYELVHPVEIGNGVRCIIYIGNIVQDRKQVEERIQKTAQLTKVNPRRAAKCLEDAQSFISREHYLSMARLIEGHIRLLYETAQQRISPDCHWAVKNIRHDIETNFSGEISLKREARLYFLNEKYVGRLFKKETGYTFHEYLNRIRLRHGAKALRETNRSVLEIALECGFQNVTYFNRLFKEAYGQPPSAYRRT